VGGWHKILGLLSSIQTNAFHACASVNVGRADFGGCI
jgi:hypothetical protein